ncbi:UNVERIFIED_CONTAM: hypothetical protein PYX00_002926 [Menopon gallinae]|uniref:Uncharacterized protein n=1 Tax=Menopon gallinae TaxID=328185 RepID=A0AAW2I060_9NEOP
MPRNWEQTKEASPLPTRVSSKIHTNADSRRLRYPSRMTSKPRTRRSTSRSRRSRSPRHKKSITPPLKRHGPTTEKRPVPRNNRSDSRPSAQPKRPRMSPRNRSKSPLPRHISRDRPHSYPVGKEPVPDKTRSTQLSSISKRDEINERFHGESKYIVDRPVFRGPDKDILHDRDNLKKILVNMRDIPTGNDRMKQSVINADDMSRRAVTGRGSRDYREMDNSRMSRPVKYDLSPPLWNNQRSYSYGRTVNHEEPARYTNRRNCDSNNASDSFRTRDPYYDEDRNLKNRDYINIRPCPRDYDSRTYDRPRDERSRDDLRYLPPTGRARSRSYERSRDPPDRKDRYEDRERIFRRSLERLPSDDRLLRRHPSPGDSRRHYDDCRILNDRRERSLDRRDLEPLHYRDHEFTTGDRFSSSDYLSKSQGYYESEYRESRMMSPSRGRGRAVSYRGRGAPSTRAFPRSSDILTSTATSERPTRTSFPPREPSSSGRRMSFPPRKSFRGSFDGRH